MRSFARPAVIDAGIALVVLAGLLADGPFGEHGTGIDAAGMCSAFAASVPLLWRRRAPLLVLATVIPGTFAANATLQSYEASITPAMVALFSVALYGERRRSLLIAMAIVPVIVVGVALAGKEAFSGVAFENVAWALLALVAGDALRWRRAVTAQYREEQAREQREREREAERRIDEERLRIAREVHDVVAHSMVAINVQAGVAAHVIDDDTEQVRNALREIKRVSGAALTDLRATLGLLREDGARAPVGPIDSLSEVGDLAFPLRAAGIEVGVAVDGDESSVPSAVGAAGYRIVQEALTNVLRHAKAARADVHVRVGRQALELEVLDDGPRTNGGGKGPGNGLRGMRERAAAIGGTVDAGRRPEGGWRVRATLPLSRVRA